MKKIIKEGNKKQEFVCVCGTIFESDEYKIKVEDRIEYIVNETKNYDGDKKTISSSETIYSIYLEDNCPICGCNVFKELNK